MNGCPYNVPTFSYAPRSIVPQRPRTSGVSLTTFIIFALFIVFLISEVYTYARKVCLEHQSRMQTMCISHQVALDAKLRRVCTGHKKLFEDRLEEVRCKCNCKREESCCEEEPEVDEETEVDDHVLATIPEETEDHFSGFKTD